MWSSIASTFNPPPPFISPLAYSTAITNLNTSLSTWASLYNYFNILTTRISQVPLLLSTLPIDEIYIPHPRTLEILVSQSKRSDVSSTSMRGNSDPAIASLLAYDFHDMHHVAKILKSLMVSKSASQGNGFYKGCETDGRDALGNDEETVIRWMNKWADTESVMLEQKRLHGELRGLMTAGEEELGRWERGETKIERVVDEKDAKFEDGAVRRRR